MHMIYNFPFSALVYAFFINPSHFRASCPYRHNIQDSYIGIFGLAFGSIVNDVAIRDLSI